MTAAAELLGELGLDGSARDTRALEELVFRFEARVPREVAPDAPRDPERVAAEFLEEGTGTIGAERTAAVRLLAIALGFAPRVVAGRRRTRDGQAPHAALLLDLPEGPALCDPAFPLPGLVPVGAAGLRSPWGSLDLSRGSRGLLLTIDGRGRRTEALELADPGDAPEALAGLPLPPRGTLGKLLEDRVAFFHEGILTVLDGWSVITQPLAEVELLERIFGTAPEGVALRSEPARLAAYDRSPLPADALRARIRTPDGFLALAPPGHAIAGLTTTEEGWRWTLEAEGQPPRTERVVRTPEGLLVTAEPATGLFASRRYAAEPTPEGSRLAVRTILATPPPRGLPEPVRKTLVFHLVSELLAWGRV